MKDQKVNKPQKQKEPLKLDILYEDEQFVAYHKPVGIPSQKTKDHKRVTFEGEVHKCCGLEKVTAYTLLHRLDKDTSGVLLFAKSKEISELGFNLFKHRHFKKEYIALCEGNLKQKEGHWVHFLDKAGSRQGKQYFKCVRSGGLKAEVSYRVIDSQKGLSLLHLYPKTGRTHQLRVQCAEMGLPIVGDSLYNLHSKLNASNHFLHAYRLSCDYENPLDIEAPLPQVFSQLAKQKGLSLKGINK